MARRRGAGRVELPIVVENAASVHALDLWLSYDAARLVAVEVRRLHAARGALMAVNDHVPGEIRIALASAGPIETADAAVLVVLFDAASGGAASSVHPLEAAIDGRPVPTLD